MARPLSWPAKGQSVETENRFPSQVLGRGKEVAGLWGWGGGRGPAGRPAWIWPRILKLGGNGGIGR